TDPRSDALTTEPARRSVAGRLPPSRPRPSNMLALVLGWVAAGGLFLGLMAVFFWSGAPPPAPPAPAAPPVGAGGMHPTLPPPGPRDSLPRRPRNPGRRRPRSPHSRYPPR